MGAQRLDKENRSTALRQQAMRNTNPKYILRNYLAQQAIDKATQQNNFSDIERLLTLLQSPYTEHCDCEEYAKAPPEWGTN